MFTHTVNTNTTTTSNTIKAGNWRRFEMLALRVLTNDGFIILGYILM
jgi:hypothetical protein